MTHGGLAYQAPENLPPRYDPAFLADVTGAAAGTGTTPLVRLDRPDRLVELSRSARSPERGNVGARQDTAAGPLMLAEVAGASVGRSLDKGFLRSDTEGPALGSSGDGPAGMSASFAASAAAS